MKLPQFFSFGSHSKLPNAALDLENVQQHIEKALQATGLDSRSTPQLQKAMDVIQRSLASAGLMPGRHGGVSPAPAPKDASLIIDVVARELDEQRAPPAGGKATPEAAAGRSVSGKYTSPIGSRAYQVYLPTGHTASTPLPMVVMLHGCTQSPDDFAAGTRMNTLADREGFIVVYPAQSKNANGSKCWNWFRTQDQARDGGEPALIAGIVEEVAARYPVDRSRIFVAGLSAGAAMAVILGQTYPDLFAAVGVHSGLAYGAAHDMPTAFSAMSGDPRGTGRTVPAARFVPTIVFHGDRDSTVNPGNGLEVASQALTHAGHSQTERALHESVEAQVTPGGQRYTRTVHLDGAGRPRIEQWLLHGAGHAWSGGSTAGSYTDPTGPDASEAMLRFFMAQAA